MPRQYGNQKRTAKQRMGDLDMFLAMARDDKIMAATPEWLAQQYGVKDVVEVGVKLARAQARIG